MEEQRELFESCTGSLQKTLQSIGKYLLDEESKSTAISEVRDIAKNYCNIDLEFKKQKAALKKTKNKLQDASHDYNATVDSVFQQMLHEMNDPDKTYETHPFWLEITNEDDNSVRVVEAESDDESDGDVNYEVVNDSVMCSQVSQNTVDPLTKKTIENPCKNKVCGHIYEYDTIKIHIKNSKKSRVVCPYIGCVNKTMKAKQLIKIKKENE